MTQATKTLPFTKMHGLSNDFVVLDRRVGQPAHAVELTPELIGHLTDRRKGVGCDQLMVIESIENDDIVARYRIFNPDGGEAEQCGNGARCVARYLFEKDKLEASFKLQAMRTEVDAECHADGSVSVTLGLPNFEPQSLPLQAEQRLSEYHVEAAGRDVKFGAVSIGNPHAVIAVKDVENTEVHLIGDAMQQHAMFPQSANVEFVEFNARDKARLRVYERGAGETMACGSGACGVVAVGRNWGWLDEEVVVQMPGGEAIITWKGEGHKIWLRGEAVFVFEGLFILS